MPLESLCAQAHLLRADGRPNGIQMIQGTSKGFKLHPGRVVSGADDRKLIAILLTLISAPYCALMMIAIGPPAVRLLLSTVHAVMP